MACVRPLEAVHVYLMNAATQGGGGGTYINDYVHHMQRKRKICQIQRFWFVCRKFSVGPKQYLQDHRRHVVTSDDNLH